MNSAAGVDPQRPAGAQNEIAAHAGEAAALLSACGSADMVVDFAPVEFGVIEFTEPEQVRHFLASFVETILQPIDLPAVVQAWQHAARGEVRELIALDRWMAAEPLPEWVAAASRRIGRQRLSRLRPLRDQRLIQRYAQAVETGTANGWHPVVYGVILAAYSVPLRQGLAHYAETAVNGLADGISQGRLSEEDTQEVLLSLAGCLRKAMESALADSRLSFEAAPRPSPADGDHAATV